jgi:hypothetical protein
LGNPQFGKIFRLVSSNGKNDNAFGSRVSDLTARYIDAFKVASPFADPNDPNKPIADILDEAYSNDVYQRIASFCPPSEAWGFLVVNEPGARDPIAAEILRKLHSLYTNAEQAFPTDTDARTRHYWQAMSQIARECAPHAINLEI